LLLSSNATAPTSSAGPNTTAVWWQNASPVSIKWRCSLPALGITSRGRIPILRGPTASVASPSDDSPTRAPETSRRLTNTPTGSFTTGIHAKTRRSGSNNRARGRQHSSSTWNGNIRTTTSSCSSPTCTPPRCWACALRRPKACSSRQPTMNPPSAWESTKTSFRALRESCGTPTPSADSSASDFVSERWLRMSWAAASTFRNPDSQEPRRFQTWRQCARQPLNGYRPISMARRTPFDDDIACTSRSRCTADGSTRGKAARNCLSTSRRSAPTAATRHCC
jgi:hypothetical protein